ncbi:alpha-1,6-mannosyl-glycoprotein 2-beta-N-acetylglucosaminyltransferase-like [Danaus plexippus]|uniref:alpha-1,6-mannosyl-glycoprotein 2-beta-N-acetylglucosaminyltransferase-like n=1 Tax=Danaus plexippus TaxID=13037 RepID=UPI002AAFC4DB|nr:alpha-1,6-mannosyl-glycoprotein 2-beta-N-acetylglucosaminyltransferase-like [Danaus plexippus]
MLDGCVMTKKIFVYPVVACAMLIYVYLEVTSRLSNSPIIIPYNNEKIPTKIQAKLAKKDIDYILHLKKVINDANRKQSTEDDEMDLDFSFIIVIQVYRGLNNLNHLVDGLKQAKGIGTALLLFSHSFYSKDINRVVRNISFARVLQIYYPYSVQLHPFVFPGYDQKTCDEVMSCRKSDRKALVIQHKHHWWWSASFVFDRVFATRNYNGTILFLEENQYVTSDFIYIFRILDGLLRSSNLHCDIISLGNGKSKSSSYRLINSSILLKPWDTKETLGIAFNKDTWKTVKNLSEHFCRYNDNRWSKSLIHLSTKTSLGKFYALSIEGSRVFRLNKCKDHKTCNETKNNEILLNFVRKIRNKLFPFKMHIVKSNSVEEVGEGNGGWTDVRDHELCLFISNLRNVTP